MPAGVVTAGPPDEVTGACTGSLFLWPPVMLCVSFRMTLSRNALLQGWCIMESKNFPHFLA